MKLMLGRLPSAWRGPPASLSMTLAKSAADTVTPTDDVHELNVSVPPDRLLIAVPMNATLLRSRWFDAPTSASMLKFAGLRNAVLFRKSMPPGWWLA